MRQVCHICGHDDDVTWMPDPDGGADYVCTSPAHPEPYAWHAQAESTFPPGRGGIAEQLGVYDDLLRCVVAGEPYVEYGVVEHRFLTLSPDVYYGDLIPRYGHTSIARTKYSVSSFLAGTLAQLRREGALAYRIGPATGFWSYLSKVSHWVEPAGADEGRGVITWAEYAAGKGIDPNSWPSRR